MWTAFPSSDYYEDSVTIGVSPRRPSRVPLTLGVGLRTIHSMSALTMPLPVVWLGDLIFALLAGGAIGLFSWRRRPEAARGHLVSSMLRWMGIVFGLLVLRGIMGLAFWN